MPVSVVALGIPYNFCVNPVLVGPYRIYYKHTTIVRRFLHTIPRPRTMLHGEENNGDTGGMFTAKYMIH